MVCIFWQFFSFLQEKYILIWMPNSTSFASSIHEIISPTFSGYMFVFAMFLWRWAEVAGQATCLSLRNCPVGRILECYIRSCLCGSQVGGFSFYNAWWHDDNVPSNIQAGMYFWFLYSVFNHFWGNYQYGPYKKIAKIKILHRQSNGRINIPFCLYSLHPTKSVKILSKFGCIEIHLNFNKVETLLVGWREY
jgi:hypothetical protein